jgi:hypothetical protein
MAMNNNDGQYPLAQTQDEIDAITNAQIAALANANALIASKIALLTKIGLTADEAKLLVG